MIKLRPEYQPQVVDGIRTSISNGHKRIIACLPTGGGKTVIFSYMVAEHLKRGGKILILTDRIELLKQANGSFSRFNLTPELITASGEPDLMKDLHVSMIETLYRRAERYNNFISTRTLIIIDEAHKTAFEKIFPFINPKAVVLGFTATPHREGKQPSLDTFYTDIVQTVDTPDLIQMGFLSKAYTYGVDIDLKGIRKKGGEYDQDQLGKMYGERKIYEGVIENYNRICPGTKALLFAPNISSSKEMQLQLTLAGLPALHLDGEMGTVERESILHRFTTLKNIILCNCGVLTTGFDCPDIETIILYRATTSLPLFLQMVGRGSRIIPGVKERFTILDFGNNINSHQFWEAPRTWSLSKKEKKLGVAPVKTCPKCGAIVPVKQIECLNDMGDGNLCDHIWQPSEKEQKEKEFAELKLLTKPQILSIASKADVKKKAEMAKAKLISPYWVLHSAETKEEAREFVNEMGYKKGFEYHNKDRFKVFQDEQK